MTTIKIRNIGNALGLSFTTKLRKEYNLKAGQEFNLVKDSSGSLILVPIIPKIYDTQKYHAGGLYQPPINSKRQLQGREEV